MQTNHFIYRAELLHEFLVENNDSMKFKVIADALDREIDLAFSALISEIADTYGVRDKSFEGLEQFNPDMIECRTIRGLLSDSNSWISQIQYLWSRQNKQSSVNLIGSDRADIQVSRQFYANCIEQLTLLVDQFRQQSVND